MKAEKAITERPRIPNFRREEQEKKGVIKYSALSPAESVGGMGSRIRALGRLLLRYGLVLVVGWIGLMKFTEYEANGIRPLVAHSPLLGSLYYMLSVQQFSNALGVVEVGIAMLIALRAWSPMACAVGSAAAVLMFLTTISFLVSTPGWEPSLGGFPALSAFPGQFLIKDVVLLGAAIWSLGEALDSRQQLAQAEPQNL